MTAPHVIDSIVGDDLTVRMGGTSDDLASGQPTRIRLCRRRVWVLIWSSAMRRFMITGEGDCDPRTRRL